MYVLNVSEDIKIMSFVEFIGFASLIFSNISGLLKRNK